MVAADQPAVVAEADQPAVLAADAPRMVVAEAVRRPTMVEDLGAVQDDLTDPANATPPTSRAWTTAIASTPSRRQRAACHVECGHCRTHGDEHPAGFVPSSAPRTRGTATHPSEVGGPGWGRICHCRPFLGRHHSRTYRRLQCVSRIETGQRRPNRECILGHSSPPRRHGLRRTAR